MTPEQVDLIRKSFDAMWSMRGDIADLCYSRFFELAPDAKDLFRGDMERQRLKLMDMGRGVGRFARQARAVPIDSHASPTRQIWGSAIAL